MAVIRRENRHLALHSLNGITRYEDPEVNVVEAVINQHLDYDIVTSNLQTQVRGKFHKIESHKAVIRPESDNHDFAFYGFSGAEWKPLLNTDLAGLLSGISENWTLDALGSINNGADTIYSFKIDSFDLNGDPTDEYLLVRNSFTPGKAITFQIVNVRLFCTNQLTGNKKSGSFVTSVVHGQNVSEGAKFAVDVLALLEKARQRTRSSYRAMAQGSVTEDQVAAFLKAVYPDPVRPRKVDQLHTIVNSGVDTAELDPKIIEELDRAWKNYEASKERVVELREETRQLYEAFNSEKPEYAGTPWALYMAATESADHREGRSPETVAQAVLFGPRADEKERAYDVALSFAEYGEEDIEYTPLTNSKRRGRTARPRTEEEIAEEAAKQAKREARRIAREARGERIPTDRTEKLAIQAEKAAAEALKLQERIAKQQAKQQAIMDRAEAAKARLQAYLATQNEEVATEEGVTIS